MGPRPHRTALALCLAVALLGVAAVASPTAASGTDATVEPRTGPDGVQALAAGTNLTVEGTAFVAAARTADGGVVVGGSTGLRRGNASLTKVTPDGTIAWTRQYPSGNASGIVDVESGPDGDVYVLRYERNGTTSEPEYGTWLGRVSGSGDVEWRRPVGGDRGIGSNDLLTVGDDGPALATSAPGGRNVTLRQYGFDGETEWTRTYGAEASPQALRAAGDGYLLVGSADFGQPWVVRVGDDGSEQVNRTYTGVELRRPVGAVPTDGGFVVAGTHRVHGPSAPAAVKVGDDGVVRWSRVYTAAADASLGDVFVDGDGLVLFGSGGSAGPAGRAGYLVGVGPSGGQRYVERVGGFATMSAVAGPDGHVTAVGIESYREQNVTGRLRTVRLPEAPAEAFTADVGVTSNATHYRGQNLALDAPSLAGETVDVVALPEDPGGEPRTVRRTVADERGRAVFESATLSRGGYYLRVDGDPVVVENGTVTAADTPEAARFDVTRHDLGRVDVGNTFVDRSAGEAATTVTLDSDDRPEYTLEVSADRYRDGSVDAGTLRRLFADDPGFEGVTQSRGVPAARIDVRGASANVTAATGGVDPGLYRVTLRGADTADGGAVAETRFVVGPERARPLSVSLSESSLSVPVGGVATTNVTVSGVSDRIGALSMSANRSGPPAIGLSTDLRVDATSSRGSARWSDRTATASARALDTDTGNGSLDVGSLTVEADAGAISPNASAATTVRFGLDWVVDADGVPYTVPAETSVPVEVTDIGNATGDRAGESASASGSVRSSGSTAG
jgi:hypothetical protein